MDYWESILNEVVNKDKETCSFMFTNLSHKKALLAASKNKKSNLSHYQKKTNKMYFLGNKYPDIYFTRRETECVLHLLEGNTIASTALLMSLSPRTVEFYVKNMKLKVGCRSKTDLLSIIVNTDLLKNIDF